MSVPSRIGRSERKTGGSFETRRRTPRRGTPVRSTRFVRKKAPSDIEFKTPNDPTIIFTSLNSWYETDRKEYRITVNKIRKFLQKQLRKVLFHEKIFSDTLTKMMNLIDNRDYPQSDLVVLTKLKRFFDTGAIRQEAKTKLKSEEKVDVSEQAKLRQQGRERRGRQESRLTDIQRYLDPIKNTVETYFDIGASEGDITRTIRDYVNPKVTIAFDIDGKQETIDNIMFKRNKPGQIDEPDNNADLVTVFMTLHHFEHLTQMLKEIRRVLKPGGRLIIRDHDTSTKYLALFFDFLHAYYMVVAGNEATSEEFVKSYVSFYKSKDTWNELISDAGFKLLFRSFPKKVDFTNAFYTVFEK